MTTTFTVKERAETDPSKRAFYREYFGGCRQFKQVYCWWPTKVYSEPYMRDGFVWLGYAWKSRQDGNVYRRPL